MQKEEIKQILKRPALNGGSDALNYIIKKYWDIKPKYKKLWQSKEWKENKEKVLDNKCKYCGKTKEEAILLPHHKYKLVSLKKHIIVIANNMFKKETGETVKLLKKKKESELRKVRACPHCDSSTITYRKSSRDYTCYHCRGIFKNPKRRLSKNIVLFKIEFNPKYLNWFFLNGKKIMDIVKKQRKQWFENYINMKNTETVCKGCHLKLEKGYVLCKRCGKYWHGPQYDTCWECFKKENPERVKEIIK